MSVRTVTLATLQAEIAALPRTASRPCIVAIAGGSASGKTTIAQALATSLPNATMFSQDLFQLGSDFSERKTSPYKWDDPKNFDLEAGAAALAELKCGREVTVPAFDVVANRRVGTTVVAPADYIVWEGIYAIGSDGLREQIDTSVFIDTPYAVRLVRRIKRFFATRDVTTIDDLSTPARQMFTFVWSAEKAFMRAQLEYAAYRVPFAQELCQAEADDFVSTMLRLVPENLRQPSEARELQSASWCGLRFVLRSGWLEIYSDETCVYAAPLEAALQSVIQQNLRDAFLT